MQQNMSKTIKEQNVNFLKKYIFKYNANPGIASHHCPVSSVDRPYPPLRLRLHDGPVDWDAGL